MAKNHTGRFFRWDTEDRLIHRESKGQTTHLPKFTKSHCDKPTIREGLTPREREAIRITRLLAKREAVEATKIS